MLLLVVVPAAPDGKTITFHLAREFTSADVPYTVLELLMKRHPRGQVTFQDLEAIYMLRVLSGYESRMVPRHLLENTAIDSSELTPVVLSGGTRFLIEWRFRIFRANKGSTK